MFVWDINNYSCYLTLYDYNAVGNKAVLLIVSPTCYTFCESWMMGMKGIYTFLWKLI